MTVGTEPLYAELGWTGVETAFAPGIKAQAKSAIALSYRDAAGAVTALTDGVHLTLSLDATTQIITAVPTAMPAASGTVIFKRTTPATQTVDFVNLQGYDAKVHAALHDAAAMRDAELVRRVGINEVSIAAQIADPTIAPAAVLTDRLQSFTAGQQTQALTNLKDGLVSVPNGVRGRSLPVRFGDMITFDDYFASDATDFGAALRLAALDLANSLGRSKTLRIYGGRIYPFSSTVHFPPNVRIETDGPENAIFTRTGDFGDSWVFGSPTQAAGGVKITGVWLTQGDPYSGSGDLTHKASSGAHFRIYGAQQATIDDSYAWRMPYGIYFHGGSVIDLRRVRVNGVWDHTNVAAQEGVAGICLDVDTTFGNPKDFNMRACSVYGAKSASRSWSVTSDGGTITATSPENIGSQYGLLVFGCETIGISAESYFQCANIDNIAFRNKVGGAIANVNIADVFLDGARNADIGFSSLDPSVATYNVTINNVRADGEFNGGGFLRVDAISGSPSVYRMKVTDCQAHAHFASSMKLLGVAAASISGNQLTHYNCLNASHGADLAFSAAVWVDAGVSRDVHVTNNGLGGGGNDNIKTLNPNYSYHGAVLSDLSSTGNAATCHIGENHDLGVIDLSGNPAFEVQEIDGDREPKRDNAQHFGSSSKRFIDVNTMVAKLYGSASGVASLQPPAAAGTGTVVLPAAPETLVGRATTDTLTNKSISGSTNTLSNIGNAALTNSSITIAGHSVSLGGTQTLSASDLTNGVTGSGAVALATSPSLTTPSLGVASASSINKVAITAPADGATLTIANGKTAAFGNSITFNGVDASVLTFQGTDTYVGRSTTDTLGNKTIDTANSNVVKVNGNTLAASAGSATVTLPNSSDTLVGRATTDTLTNKSLTGPTIAGGTINNAAIGGSTPAAGAFTTLSANGASALVGTATITATSAGGDGLVIKSPGNSNGLTFQAEGGGAGIARIFYYNGATLPIKLLGKIIFDAATTAMPSINVPAGTAPTSPSDGDIWYDGTNLKFRQGGTTKSVSLV